MASIQNSSVYLIKYVFNVFVLTLGLFELSAGLGGEWRVIRLGERGWEDCVFLQLSRLEVICKAARTEALRKKPQSCKSWHQKGEKDLSFGLFSVLSHSSAWQSRCKTRHAAFGDAGYSTRSGIIRDSLVLPLMTGWICGNCWVHLLDPGRIILWLESFLKSYSFWCTLSCLRLYMIVGVHSCVLKAFV